jgi:hypothetical protein
VRNGRMEQNPDCVHLIVHKLELFKTLSFSSTEQEGELQNNCRKDARKRTFLSLYQPKRKLGSEGVVACVSRAHAMNTSAM